MLILFGGNSYEHYVSIKSTKSVLSNIDYTLFDIEVAGIDFDATWYKYLDDYKYLDNWKNYNIKKINNIIEYVKKFDVVFPIMHGKNVEDGKLQGMLELFNIKFVGCGSLASSILMDKEISKLLFKSIGLKQVPYITIDNNYNLDNIDYPVIVKPVNGGSSIGINKCNNKEELNKAIKEAKRYDDKVIIEKFIKARELEVAVLEDNNNLIISKPGEIVFDSNFYDFDTKYISNNSKTIIPNNLDIKVVKLLREYSKLIFNKLRLKGLSRIDYFYDEENSDIYINEVNTMPGFTKISMYPKLIKDAGISYKDLITKLINNACNGYYGKVYLV